MSITERMKIGPSIASRAVATVVLLIVQEFLFIAALSILGMFDTVSWAIWNLLVVLGIIAIWWPRKTAKHR